MTEKKDPTRKIYIKDTPFEAPYCTEPKNAGNNAWTGTSVTSVPDNRDRRDGSGGEDSTGNSRRA